MSNPGLSARFCPHTEDKKPERRIFFIQLGISDTSDIYQFEINRTEADRQLVLLINPVSSTKNTTTLPTH
jgi:hypothetical protein